MALKSILLKITGDPSDAKRALQETAAELKRFDGTAAQASIALKGEADLRKKIDVVKAKLVELDKQKATPEIELQTATTRAELERLEVKLKEFDGKTVEAKATLRSEAIKAQIEIVKARLERLSAQESTPKVRILMGRAVEQLDRLEAKLSDLDGKDVTVDVNVDRHGAVAGITGAVSGATTAIGGAVTGIGAFVSAATAGIPAVARLVELAAGIGPALIVVLPVMAALVSSFIAAAAGAAALGVALAGALGPVALVGLVAVTKLVQAFQASGKHAQESAAASTALASAQDALKASSDRVAQSQQNVKDQTTQAYRAWSDAIQAVKNDLLGVESAQRGIEDANLSLKQAQQNLKDVRDQVGATGHTFDAVFSKFTDVSVDTSGLKKAILSAAGQSGGGISGDDELKLEEAIQRVRDAKTGEKEATNRLHIANTQLSRDRETEADFAKRGIEAFGPYRQAVDAATQATLSLAASRRQLAQASKAQVAVNAEAPTGAVAGLVATIKNTGELVNKAFGDALDAIFSGANAGLREFSKSLKDPAIVKSLTDIGKAIGSTFVTFGRLFSNKEFRTGFVTLAEGGAKLVKIIGQRIFVDFTTLMVRLAVAALPDLIRLFENLATKLHAFVSSTRSAEKFREQIHGLIESTQTWGTRLGEIVKFLADVVEGLNAVFRFGRRATNLLRDLVVGDTATNIGKKLGEAMTGWINGALRDIGGFVTRTLSRLGSLADQARKIGSRVGHGLVDGISAGLRGLVGIGRVIANGLIDAVNFAIHAINHGLPDKLNLPGLPDINLPSNPIPEIPHLASGGIALRDVLARIGEAGREAVLPLTRGVLGQIGQGIVSSTPQMLTPAFAGTGRAGTHIDTFNANINAPAGELPDVRHTSSALIRLMERSGAGGDVGQE